MVTKTGLNPEEPDQPSGLVSSTLTPSAPKLFSFERHKGHLFARFWRAFFSFNRTGGYPESADYESNRRCKLNGMKVRKRTKWLFKAKFHYLDNGLTLELHIATMMFYLCWLHSWKCQCGACEEDRMMAKIYDFKTAYQ